MAVLKVACPKCGQRVSGDDTFYGTTVECPICSSTIRFPENPNPSRAASAPPSLTLPETPPQLGPASTFVDSVQVPSAAPIGYGFDPAPAAAPASAETTSIQLPPLGSTPTAPAAVGGEVPSPVLGVVSMVLGIVSVMLFCVPAILFGPAAIISGHLALAKAKRITVRPVPGKGAAITGLILGYLSLVGFIIVLLALQPVVDAIRQSAPPE